jgi:hypothetical protein
MLQICFSHTRGKVLLKEYCMDGNGHRRITSLGYMATCERIMSNPTRLAAIISKGYHSFCRRYIKNEEPGGPASHISISLT